MIYDSHIIVTAEANHSVIFEFTQGGVPYSVVGRVYAMVIRSQEDGTVTAGDVTFACTAVSNRAECIGNCAGLVFGQRYFFQVVEDGQAIISGTCDVVKRLV